MSGARRAIGIACALFAAWTLHLAGIELHDWVAHLGSAAAGTAAVVILAEWQP